MFEKVKRGVKKVRSNVKKMKAKSRGMSVENYENYKQQLKAKEMTERESYERWKIEEKYKQKRKRDQKRGVGGDGLMGLLDAGTKVGRNFAKNVMAESKGTSGFNEALTGETKKKGKKKKKRRVVTYYY